MDRLLPPRQQLARVLQSAMATPGETETLALEKARKDSGSIRKSLQRRTPPRSPRLDQVPHAHQKANLMKQTEERHSESRMRQICKSGSMRGMEVGGHWPWASHSVASIPTLPDPIGCSRPYRCSIFGSLTQIAQLQGAKLIDMFRALFRESPNPAQDIIFSSSPVPNLSG